MSYWRSGGIDQISVCSRPLSCSWPGCTAVLACISGCACSRGMRRVVPVALWGGHPAANPCLARIRAGRARSVGTGRDAGWRQEILQETNAPDAAARQRLNKVRTVVPVAFGAAIGAILVARAVRRALRAASRDDPDHLSRGAATSSSQPASACWKRADSAKIPHASVCGGRGRCSTCRVRVVQGGASHPSSQRGRTPCPRPGRGAAQCAPGLSVAPHTQPGSDTALADQRPGECWLCHAWAPCRAGAGDCRAVR